MVKKNIMWHFLCVCEKSLLVTKVFVVVKKKAFWFNWYFNGQILTNQKVVCWIKNPAHGRKRISRLMRLVGPIQFWRGCVIYLKKKKKINPERLLVFKALQIGPQMHKSTNRTPPTCGPSTSVDLPHMDNPCMQSRTPSF